MTNLPGADATRFSYSRNDRMVRLATGGFALALVLGGVWVLLANRADAVAAAIVSALLIPAAAFCWITLRGAMDRRGSVLCRLEGLVFTYAEGQDKTLAWSEVEELRHVWQSADPHLLLTAREAPGSRRIYYEIERADELVTIIARRAERIVNSYFFPLELVRPALPRAMALPILAAVPALSLAVLPVMHGVWFPGLVLGGIGAFIILGSYRLHRRQPLAILVSESAGIVWKSTRETRSVGLGQLTGVSLEMAARGPRRPILAIKCHEGPGLVVDFGWVDPVRLYALIERARARGKD